MTGPSLTRRSGSGAARSRRLSVFAVAAALLLTSCIRFDADIEVTEDGSGSVNLITAINPESFQEIVGDMDVPADELGDSEELCAEFEAETELDDLPAGATSEPYEEDGFCGARITVELPAGDDHSAILTGVLDQDTTLRRDVDNGWSFSTAPDFSDLDTGEAPEFLLNALLGSAEVRYEITLPGSAGDEANNATSVDGGTFVWDIDLTDPPASLFAGTQPGGSGGLSWLWIPLVIAGLLLAGLAAFLMLRNRRIDAATDDIHRVAEAPASAATSSTTLGAAVPPSTVAATSESEQTLPAGSSVYRSAEPAATTELAATAETAATAEATQAASSPTPTWDAQLGAWVVDHPDHGPMRHDQATNTWVRLT